MTATRPKTQLIQDIFDRLPMDLVDREDEQILFRLSARELAAIGRLLQLATDAVARRWAKQKKLLRSRSTSRREKK